MKFKLFGTGFAATVLLASSFSAQGADMPIPAPVYKGVHSVVAFYNWTGFYLGINGGYAWGTSNWSLVPGLGTKPSGGLVGGTFGYNYQVGSMVYGLEGDIDWSGVKDTVTCGAGVVNCETSNTWLGTVRGRLGYAFDRWLPYLTGGAAFGNVKATASVPLLGAAVSSSNTQLGWTVGAGLEYAFLSNWTAKIEYLYADLGKFDTGPAPFVNNVSFKENIVRLGLNYKFAGPVFSRY